MSWIQIIIHTSVDLAENTSEILSNAGALAVTFEDAKDEPLFEPAPESTPLWQATKVIGLFDANVDIVSLKKYLTKYLDPEAIQTLKIEPLEDKDWIRAGMDHFQPMRFGKKLMICPSWCENPDPTAISLMLDPGLAFGTGTHPTTRLCLEWLDQHPPVDAVVIDYGCGSGILAIAALKLGARFVYAVDNDSQALTSTQYNAKNNDLSEKNLLTLLPNALDASLTENKKVDLLLANILANPLISLAPIFAALVRDNGTIVLSGFLENQVDAVFEPYKPWFKLLETTSIEGWVRMSASRISNL